MWAIAFWLAALLVTAAGGGGKWACVSLSLGSVGNKGRDSSEWWVSVVYAATRDMKVVRC